METQPFGMSPLAMQLLSRAIAWVTRWHREPVIHRDESDAEHHSLTGRMAYEIGLLLRELGYKVRPDFLCVVGNYHDESEVITGDHPKGLKYSERINVSRELFEDMEEQAIQQLWPDYPPFLTRILRRHAGRRGMNMIEGEIIRYADSLAAFGFMLDEASFGNTLMRDKTSGEWETIQGYQWPWLVELRKVFKVP